MVEEEVQFQGILSISLRAGRLAAGKVPGPVPGPELPEAAFMLLNIVGIPSPPLRTGFSTPRLGFWKRLRDRGAALKMTGASGIAFLCEPLRRYA